MGVSSYISVMILRAKDGTCPIYDMKLREKGGHSSIEFLCSASSDSYSPFQKITLEIHLGNDNSKYHDIMNFVTQRRISGNARTPIKPIGFYSNVSQSPLTEREVKSLLA